MTRFASVLMVIGLLAGSIFFSACSAGAVTAEEGDTVKVLYTGTLDDGTVFDSSELQGGDPLEFTIGEGQLLADFEQAVIGLTISESTTVYIPADEAYGPLEVVGNLDEFPEDEPPEVGEQYQVGLENGNIIVVQVTSISGSSVTLENTNQLAGEDLTFKITLVEILTPTPTPTLIPTTTTTQTAEEGDTVMVLYTGTLDDGTLFDSSELQGGDPLQFIIGEGTLIPSFEQAVIGLTINESTTVYIPADEAYGPLEVVVNLDEYPEDEPPEVGQIGYWQLENGTVIEAEVIEVSGSSGTLENTHQLAGENLTFEITLVEIL